MRKAIPRLLIAGANSGCGKTTVVCAILQALKNRGYDVAAFKCGPDYIDPMFHTEIIGAPSANVDLYFAGAKTARALFARHARSLNVIEGVMGYYDGLRMDSAEASSWDVARALASPAVLVIDGHGMALSAAAVVKGFQALRAPSGIAGVIVNRVSTAVYAQLKPAVEAACGVPVYGHLPTGDYALESRHLGLVTAQEVEGLSAKMQSLARQAEKTIDLDGLIALMRAQPELDAPEVSVSSLGEARIAVARDRAFCFYYRDNLELLEALGARLVPFSPLADAALPACDGLYLGGGYPELYLEALSGNASMRASVRAAVQGGLPTIAECGGFMYLTEAIDDWPMAGALPTRCRRANGLIRFGYAELTAGRDSLLFCAGDAVRGHEFHHWDAEEPGDALAAQKPSGKSWRCAYTSDTLYAGYPHLYFASNPSVAERFVRKCLERRRSHEADGDRAPKL